MYQKCGWKRRNESQDENKSANKDEAKKRAKNSHYLQIKLEVVNQFD
jgi:hypothetical protein